MWSYYQVHGLFVEQPAELLHAPVSQPTAHFDGYSAGHLCSLFDSPMFSQSLTLRYSAISALLRSRSWELEHTWTYSFIKLQVYSSDIYLIVWQQSLECYSKKTIVVLFLNQISSFLVIIIGSWTTMTS